jgi:hypothetical protein
MLPKLVCGHGILKTLVLDPGSLKPNLEKHQFPINEPQGVSLQVVSRKGDRSTFLKVDCKFLDFRVELILGHWEFLLVVLKPVFEFFNEAIKISNVSLQIFAKDSV